MVEGWADDDNISFTTQWKRATVALATAIVLQTSGSALAAQSGGRMGGGGFRSRSAASTSTHTSAQGHAVSDVHVHHVHHSPMYTPVMVVPMAPLYPAAPMAPMAPTAPTTPAGDSAPFSGLFPILMAAFVAVVALGMFQNLFGGGSEREDDGAGYYDGDDEGMSVIRVQVGLLGIARDLQLDLERIAERADTDTEEGVPLPSTPPAWSHRRDSNEGALSSQEYWAYGNSGSASTSSPDEAEERFGTMSMEERGKFREETLVNVDSRRRQSEAMTRDESKGPNEFIVVTLLAAVDGAMRMPQVSGAEEMRSALTRLGGVRVDQVAAVEVLWTPQDVNDSMTSDELVRDYPKLVPL
ncbi:hypothetical protein CYMTET_12535 [Cymbomonas tetramitiformis]|uniref:DUF1517 domain-containing protein n=1 Tax=Cymbomonas tetramitiformis TaxID=36881 RepID=A0AAE0GLG8_9CHLO|nr:hypothetical protein CYMTET_12535 [Cymbomonas tetramitiformis]